MDGGLSVFCSQYVPYQQEMLDSFNHKHPISIALIKQLWFTLTLRPRAGLGTYLVETLKKWL